MIVQPWLLRLMAPKAWFGNVRGPEDVITLGFAADLRAWTHWETVYA